MVRWERYRNVALLLPIWVWGFPSALFAFSIAVPTEGSIVEPGQTVPVRVELAIGIDIRHVRYYWYREGQEPVGSHHAKPALVASASSEPPFGGPVPVPKDAIGMIRLMAVGEVVRGRLAGREEFGEILLRAEPTAKLIRIDFATEKPWRLKTIGRVLEIPVLGEFSDGVERLIRGTATGSTFRTSNERVVKVHQNGLLRVVGNGRSTLFVANRGKQGALDIVVNGYGDSNEWPQADAGPDLTVKSGNTVTLNGNRSIDLDGDPLRYRWSQVRGNKVPLLDLTTLKATFVAPRVSERRLFRFQLQVTDMEGADTLKGADSLPSYINVWVRP